MKELDIVTLLHDIPEKSLVAEQMGTILEILDEDVFEVEFSDDSGTSGSGMGLLMGLFEPCDGNVRVELSR